VFITDGVSLEDAAVVQEAANRLHSNSFVKMMVVGVTDAVDDAQLAVIAGSRGEVYRVDEFSSLEETLTNNLVLVRC
jgi:hypothetical protein